MTPGMAGTATALGCLGLAAGPVVAWIGRRLPNRRPASVDPFRARYVIGAVAGGALGISAGLAEPGPLAAGLAAVFGWQLLLIALVDGEHYWLPDRLTLPLLASGLLAAVILDRLRILDAVTGAAAGFAVLWALARVYFILRRREGLGGGDPFLLAGIGAWVGWIGLPGVLLWASLAGLSVVAARAILGRKVSGSDRLPFGVFLAIGGWLTWILGPLGL